MRKKYQRSRSRAARWAPRFAYLGVIILIISGLLHRFSVIATNDFFMLVGGAGFCAIVSLLFALKGFLDLWQYGAKGGLASLRACVFSLIALAPVLAAAIAWFMLPPLYDISTDIENPPMFIAGSRPVDALPVRADLSNQAEEQLDAWPQLSGRRYDSSPDRILESVIGVLDDLGWKKTDQKTGIDDSETIIEATATTLLLGFVSDVAIRLTDEGDTTFVDIRATSRYLRRDFGISADFINDFLTALDEKVLLTPTSQDDE